MSNETAVSLREDELEELYVLLLARESKLHPALEDLKRRLERTLYERRSIAEMEALTQRATDGSK